MKADSLSIAFLNSFCNWIGVLIEISIEIVRKDNTERVLVHYDVLEVNASFNLENLVKNFDFSAQRREDVLFSHLFSIHLLNAYLRIERVAHVTS